MSNSAENMAARVYFCFQGSRSTYVRHIYKLCISNVNIRDLDSFYLYLYSKLRQVFSLPENKMNMWYMQVHTYVALSIRMFHQKVARQT